PLKLPSLAGGGPGVRSRRRLPLALVLPMPYISVVEQYGGEIHGPRDRGRVAQPRTALPARPAALLGRRLLPGAAAQPAGAPDAAAALRPRPPDQTASPAKRAGARPSRRHVGDDRHGRWVGRARPGGAR